MNWSKIWLLLLASCSRGGCSYPQYPHSYPKYYPVYPQYYPVQQVVYPVTVTYPQHHHPSLPSHQQALHPVPAEPQEVPPTAPSQPQAHAVTIENNNKWGPMKGEHSFGHSLQNSHNSSYQNFQFTFDMNKKKPWNKPQPVPVTNPSPTIQPSTTPLT